LKIPQGTEKEFSLDSLKNHLYLASFFQCPFGVIYILPHQNLKKKFDVLSFCKEFSLLEVVKLPYCQITQLPVLTKTHCYLLAKYITNFLGKLGNVPFSYSKPKEHTCSGCVARPFETIRSSGLSFCLILALVLLLTTPEEL